MKLILTFLMTILLFMNISCAANPKKTSTKEPSKDSRQKMAKLHEKMATCLKSNKPMSECHKEMHNNCQSMMGENGCPMMGRMMGNMGNMMMGKNGCPMMSE